MPFVMYVAKYGVRILLDLAELRASAQRTKKSLCSAESDELKGLRTED